MAHRPGRSGVKFTCPDIDSLINDVKSVIRDAEYGIKNEEYANDCLKDIIHTLSTFEDRLEELRNSNSTLRDFGDEQYELALELGDKVDSLEYEISNLKDESQSLKEEIDEIYRNNDI